MVPISPTAQVVARRLLTAAQTKASSSETPDGRRYQVDAADRVGQDLARALSRSLGPQAYYALLARALSQAKSSHPPLALLAVHSPLEPYLEGLDGAAAAHGPEALVDALVSLFAVLTDLLGRLIGEDMAVALVTRAARPASDVGRDTESDLPRDGGTAA